MDEEPKRMPLGKFNSDRLNKNRFVLGPNPEERIIDPEIVGAVRAIRNTGIETMSSSAGTTSSLTKGWGSFILLNLMISPEGKDIAKKIRQFADSITGEVRGELNNPSISLQLVSAERFNEDMRTTSMQTSRHDIYRLQLIGFADDDQIRYMWNKVAERFNASVVE